MLSRPTIKQLIEELDDGSLTTEQIADKIKTIKDKAIKTKKSSIEISPLLKIFSLKEVIDHQTIFLDVFDVIYSLFGTQKLELTSEIITYLLRILANPASASSLIKKVLECIQLFTCSCLIFSRDHIHTLLGYEKNQSNERVTSSILLILSNLSLDRGCSASITAEAQTHSVSTRLLVKAINMKCTSKELLESLCVCAADNVIMTAYELSSLLRTNSREIDAKIQKLHSQIDSLSSQATPSLPLRLLDDLFLEFNPRQQERSGLVLSALDRLIQKNLIHLDSFSVGHAAIMNNHITNQGINLSTVSVFNIFSYIRATHANVVEKSNILFYIPTVLSLIDESTPEDFRLDLYSSFVLILDNMFGSYSGFVRGINALESLDSWPVREEVLSARSSLSIKLTSQLTTSKVLAKNSVPEAQQLIQELTQPSQSKLFPISPHTDDTGNNKKRDRAQRHENNDSDDESIEELQSSPKKQRTPPRLTSSAPLEEIDAPSPQKQSPFSKKPTKRTRQSLPETTTPVTTSSSTLYGNGSRRASSSSAPGKKPGWR